MHYGSLKCFLQCREPATVDSLHQRFTRRRSPVSNINLMLTTATQKDALQNANCKTSCRTFEAIEHNKMEWSAFITDDITADRKPVIFEAPIENKRSTIN